MLCITQHLMFTTYLLPRQWGTWRCQSGRRSRLLWAAWSWFSSWSWHWPRASLGTWPRGSVRQRLHTTTAARLLSSLHQTPLQAHTDSFIHLYLQTEHSYNRLLKNRHFKEKCDYLGHTYRTNTHLSHIFLY